MLQASFGAVGVIRSSRVRDAFRFPAGFILFSVSPSSLYNRYTRYLPTFQASRFNSTRILRYPPGQQILFLRRYQVWAVDREERIAFAHILIGGVGKDLADVAGKPDLYGRLEALVNIDRARRPNIIVQLFVFDGAGRSSDSAASATPASTRLRRGRRMLSVSM